MAVWPPRDEPMAQGTPGSSGLAASALLAPLRNVVPIGWIGRQVEDVETHVGDIGQAAWRRQRRCRDGPGRRTTIVGTAHTRWRSGPFPGRPSLRTAGPSSPAIGREAVTIVLSIPRRRLLRDARSAPDSDHSVSVRASSGQARRLAPGPSGRRRHQVGPDRAGRCSRRPRQRPSCRARRARWRNDPASPRPRTARHRGCRGRTALQRSLPRGSMRVSTHRRASAFRCRTRAPIAS